MEYRQMYEEPGIFETGEIKDAKDCSHPKVRFNLQRKRLKTMPKGFEAAAHIPHVQFDLSYNSGLDHATVITELSALPHLKGLGMTKTEMEVLPDSIGTLQELEALEVTGNKLKALPDSIGQLKNLRILNLRTNRFTTFPKNLVGLHQLEQLSFRFNEIKTLPKDLSEFPRLQILDLSSNGITALPPAIKDLTQLKELHIKYNKLTSLPEELGSLQELEVVALNGNEKLDVDQAIRVLANCKKLRKLRLKGMAMKTLPDSITLLENLESIDLESNGIKELPPVLGQLKKLKEIIGFGELPAPFYIDMIKDRADITTFSSYRIQPYMHNGLASLPENVESLCHITSMELSELQALPASLSRLSGLTSLSFHECDFSSLPDLSGLTALENLSFSDTTLTVFPEFIYHLPALKSLTLGGCTMSPDFARLAQLPQLEELQINDITETDLRLLQQAPCLNWVQLARDVTVLPEAFFELPGVHTFSFNNYPQIDPDSILSRLQRMPGLQWLIFNDDNYLPFEWYISRLKELPLLKRALIYVDSAVLPVSLLELPHLERLKINFSTKCVGIWSREAGKELEVPLALANTRDGQIRLQNVPAAAPFRTAFEQLATLGLTDPGRREIAFGLLAHHYVALKKLLPYPFDAAGNIPGARVFITGTPTLSVKKDLATMLANRGATIVKEVKDATHIFLGQNINPATIGDIFREDHQYILEDHLKAQEIKDDTPFLMMEENSELTTQITRLLKQQETDNISLVLEMITGGGAGKVLLSYLAAIHLFHKDADIRKKSRTLFRKYASATLQHHIKSSWKDKYKDRSEDECRPLYIHPELDVCAFLLAFHMVRIHEPGNPRRPAGLVLRDVPSAAISEIMADFDHVTYLNLDLKDTHDLPRLVGYIQQLRITYLSLQLNTDTVPAELFTLPLLEALTLITRSATPLTIPVLDKLNVSLTELRIYQTSLLHAERLVACKQLRRLDLSSCKLPDVSFIASMTGLQRLELTNTGITQIPDSFYQLQELEEFDLTSNDLSVNTFDFKQLKKLQKVYVNNRERLAF
ncbi:leucine-rich repeat domain-containing protein [Chitinophaga flava]|uniref:Disease resistance R13L4/SHOC-2-like LRR domain-containing protein n=1 Tax=Chitinophaga flava TaxID=2259036 RepID=A0A365XQ15_9BACT|nr:leucine-rich repeat domain-containing protein [Chitinophaga flava]RBL88218.1 hypothetical protein DF182_16595 [Chitinophaga flava]